MWKYTALLLYFALSQYSVFMAEGLNARQGLLLSLLFQSCKQNGYFLTV